MIRGVAIVLFAIIFTSCESNFKEVQMINFSEFTPSGEARDFNLKYTDSGRITSILVSKQMLDFGAVKHPFTEFPKGVDVTFFDKDGKKTFIRSDYAVQYKQTQIIDLQGNVRISNETGQLMETSQLYFDQKHEWFYTEREFKFTDPKGVSYGQGIDFSKDFKIVNSQRVRGDIQQTE
jgi:LPS export ABC transporter protein LptC